MGLDFDTFISATFKRTSPDKGTISVLIFKLFGGLYWKIFFNGALCLSNHLGVRKI